MRVVVYVLHVTASQSRGRAPLDPQNPCLFFLSLKCLVREMAVTPAFPRPHALRAALCPGKPPRCPLLHMTSLSFALRVGPLPRLVAPSCFLCSHLIPQPLRAAHLVASVLTLFTPQTASGPLSRAKNFHAPESPLRRQGCVFL